MQVKYQICKAIAQSVVRSSVQVQEPIPEYHPVHPSIMTRVSPCHVKPSLPLARRNNFPETRAARGVPTRYAPLAQKGNDSSRPKVQGQQPSVFHPGYSGVSSVSRRVGSTPGTVSARECVRRELGAWQEGRMMMGEGFIYLCSWPSLMDQGGSAVGDGRERDPSPPLSGNISG